MTPWKGKNGPKDGCSGRKAPFGKENIYMKQLKAGVVGVGFIGAVHIEQLRRLGNVEVALAD